MNRFIFILLSALFFMFIAVSMTDHMYGKGFQGNPIPIHVSISIVKPEAIIPITNIIIFISSFSTFSSDSELRPLARLCYNSPPISTSHGASKIPNSKSLNTNQALIHVRAILPRSSSNSDPLPA
jgi:hypothetical protein